MPHVAGHQQPDRCGDADQTEDEEGRGDGGFGSLADVSALFQDPWTLLAGWIHYLAFDLLTGVWETRDAARRGVPHWLVVPCLFLTFMFGPAGWLLYMGVRNVRR